MKKIDKTDYTKIKLSHLLGFVFEGISSIRSGLTITLQKNIVSLKF